MNGMSSGKVVLYLACIFWAGAVSGWLFSNRPDTTVSPPPTRHEEFAAQLKQRCRAKITNLTPDQEEKMDRIVTAASLEMKSIHERNVGRIRQVVSNRNQKLQAILSPEQQKQFEQMEKERREGGRGRNRDHKNKNGESSRRDRSEPGGTNQEAADTNRLKI